MKSATIESKCECQAKLFAELDEERRALRGWAKDSRGRERSAPANAMHVEGGRFDVGFMCPFCTRNTLRSFEAETLAFR
jgi:hypothetical protein